MKFGTWSTEEIEKALRKIDLYYETREELKNKCKNITYRLYERYKTTHEHKSTLFGLIKTKVLDEKTFFNRTWSLNIDGINIHVDNVHLKKYDVYYEDYELKLLSVFRLSFYKYDEHNEIRKLKEGLTYCIGGDISPDEIYLLCDVDNYIKTYQLALEDYRSAMN